MYFLAVPSSAVTVIVIVCVPGSKVCVAVISFWFIGVSPVSVVTPSTVIAIFAIPSSSFAFIIKFVPSTETSNDGLFAPLNVCTFVSLFPSASTAIIVRVF